MNTADLQTKKDPSSKLILIVDDDEEILEFLITLLANEGFRTKSAMDGRIAIKRVREESTHLVLLDIMMPNMGGYEVIRQLSGDSETRDIPVIVMTAHRSDRSTYDMIRQEPNVKEIIHKPVSPFQFRKLVHDTLNTISETDRRILERELSHEEEFKSLKDAKWEIPPGLRGKGKGEK